jgi:hypothetical protein
LSTKAQNFEIPLSITRHERSVLHSALARMWRVRIRDFDRDRPPEGLRSAYADLAAIRRLMRQSGIVNPPALPPKPQGYVEEADL